MMNIQRLEAYVTESISFLIPCVFLGLMATTGCDSITAGQEGHYFIANGKRVNIEYFEEEVAKMLEGAGVPGMSVAIIENDEVVFANGYGRRKQGKSVDTYPTSSAWGYSVKDMDTTLKVDKATVFNGASLSKTYLAFVAYQLVDEGLLDMDKPMYEYLEYELLAHDDRYKLITPRMVLSHSSGLENWRYQNDGNILEILKEPGEAYVYSGEGYFYLYYVIKQLLNNKSYSEFTQERVIDKLGLKNSFVQYSGLKEGETWEDGIPSNFAVAHPLSGGQYLMRNVKPNPAFANHFSAEDYAKVVLAMFNPEYVSDERRKDLLDPKVRIDKSSVFYAPAFKVVFNEGDTIISHGGDNAGIKNLMFYSPVQKRGFVMMTNADHGKSLGAKLNELTVNLDIDQYLDIKHDLISYIQYPNASLPLIKIFNEKDSAAMFSELEVLKRENKINAIALNGLAMFFLYFGDDEIGGKILEDAEHDFPNSSLRQCLLGDFYLGKGNYQQALNHYKKARELNFDAWDIDGNIELCEQEISAAN